MKRMILLSMLVLATIVAAGVAMAGGRPGQSHKTRAHDVIHVIEHATTDAVTNHSDGAADSVGDMLTFTNQVFDASDTTPAGHDQGYCIRMTVGESWECSWTTFLGPGQITVQGPFFDTRDSRLAITGGTESYADASGWMQLSSREGGTKYDFVFHLDD
jgi:allene oxide cyclase